MGHRRQARECAVQMLYELEFSGNSLAEVLEKFWESQGGFSEDIRQFANFLVEGVVRKGEEIDRLIVEHSTHWKLSRMAAVDKNVLRLAVFELKNCGEIPKKVTLNESIEIAKKFGSEESSSFINGVLDKIASEMGKE